MKLAGFIIAGSYAGPTRPIRQIQHSTEKVDCSSYFERFAPDNSENRGPRPNPDPIDDSMSDWPLEYAEDQIKQCKDELDMKLWRKWLEQQTIEITKTECDDFVTISDDRGPRPDFESFTNDEVTNEDQIKNVLGIDDLPSIDLIEIYCNEMMTPDDIPATDNPTTLTIEPTADPTLNPESISTPGDLPDYEHNYDEPLLAKDVFQPRILASESQEFIAKRDICDSYANVCCPLFQRTTDTDNFSGFPAATEELLSDENAKAACSKNQFMPCCVTPELCELYPDMPHCSKENQITTTSKTSTTTTTTTSTTTTISTTTTSITTTESPILPDGSKRNGEATADTFIAGNGNENPDGKLNEPNDENEENKKESARTGMILLFVIIGMVILLVTAVLVARAFWTTPAEAPVAKDEDSSLLVNNVPEETAQQQQQSTDAQQTV